MYELSDIPFLKRKKNPHALRLVSLLHQNVCVSKPGRRESFFKPYFFDDTMAPRVKQNSPLCALVYACFLCSTGTMPDSRNCWNTQALAMPPFWQLQFLTGEFKKGAQNYSSHKGPSAYYRKKKESHYRQSHANLPSTIWDQKHWVHFGIILLDLVTPTFFSPLLGILGAINCGNLKVNIEWWPWIWEVMEKQMLLLTKKITS